MNVRRKAIDIESLHTEAPERIHAMLVGLVEKKTRDALIKLVQPAKAKVPEAAALSEHQLAAFPKATLQEFAKQAGASDAAIQDALGNDQFFADADGDGQRDMNDMHTLEEIRELYKKLNVNAAELLGLRLYTGPMFELFNNVLRAKGGTVPFGGSYPGKAGEVTTGKFVTTIVSNLTHAARSICAALAGPADAATNVCTFRSLSQHAINSGIVKLSSLTPVINVYRGMTGLALPPELEGTDKHGSRLAIEYGEFPALVGPQCALASLEVCL